MPKPLAKLCNILSLLFGNFSYSAPPWLHSIRQKRHALLSIFLVLILCVFSVFGYRWYQSLPKAVQITALITAPRATPLAEELVPEPLNISFGIENSSHFDEQSVAPLNQLSKEITSGVTLDPKIKGTWFWKNDHELIFKPAHDWPAGQPYDINFNSDFFATNKKIKSYTYSFSTQPLTQKINELRFYQDPTDPKIRRVIATIEFNYPINPSDFEQHITLKQQATNLYSASSYALTVTYDTHKRIAYIQSEPLPQPDTATYLELNLAKGVKARDGPSKTDTALTQTVLIPDASQFFKIESVHASIVRNMKDQPEQILTLETGTGVTETEINKHIHAFLLPVAYPETSVEDAKPNYHWQNPGEVTPEILNISTPIPLIALATDRTFATQHSFQFSANTTRFMYIKIDKGVKSFGDYTLTEDYTTVIPVPEYPREISFLHKGALLALSGEKKFSVSVRGIPGAYFSIARVLPHDINQLVTQTDGDYSNPYFFNYSFNEQNISEIFSEIREFPQDELNQQNYLALDLEKYLNQKSNQNGPLGLFLLKARGYQPKTKSFLDIETERLILITDLGLVVKDNYDDTHDVFVQSITKGTPVLDASISVLGKNGLSIFKTITDKEGHAIIPNLKSYVDERAPSAYLASKDHDVSFIPYSHADRQLNYSRFDVGGMMMNDFDQTTLSAYLFTDRGIYRPGDTVHIGMIVKQLYAEAAISQLPLELIVTDSRGITIKDQKMVLDQTGFMSADFPTNTASATGQYMINLFIVKDNHPSSLLGSTTIQVAEFLPDRMRISARLSQESSGWITPNDLSAKITLMNLYGKPATKRKIAANIILNLSSIKFNAYPNYIFVDPLIDPKKPAHVYTDTLPETETDDQGLATFNLELNRYDKATYQLNFFAEGFEAEGGRSVTTQISSLVSPLQHLIGYKSDGDLRYIQQKTKRTLRFIAINSKLELNSLSSLKLEVLEEKPVTTLVKKPNGTYQYESLIQTILLKSDPYIIDKKGIDYILNTEKIGDYIIRLVDDHQTLLTQVRYSVVGESQKPIPKNAELNLKLNKSEFKAGDTIDMEITAPYTGSGLITIERDRVYAHQWFKTNTTSSLQKIKIPRDFKGNGYVNVSYVRDLNSNEIGINPLSYSIEPFAINHNDHQLSISLNVPKVTKPGEPLAIQYKSDEPGKIIVFAVDEGILQVTHYKTPDPLAFFFQKRALQVTTQQILDQILPKFNEERERSSVGGDCSEELVNHYLNPFKRKTDNPVVYWSKILETDTTNRELIYNVPDYFNGSLRIMAVAVSNETIGAAEINVDVRGDFIINPNVPTFVAPDDEFEITASIANNVKNSDPNSSVSVEITTDSSLDILSGKKQTLNIKEGQEETIHVKLRALNKLGSSQITFIAKQNNKSSKITATLSIRPSITYKTTLTSGESSKKELTVAVSRDLYLEHSDIHAVLATNPIIFVTGLERYLSNFPFGCTEQLVSKAFPLLVMRDQPWFVTNYPLLNSKIDATIQNISQRQMSNGAFSYWPNMGENISNDFASVYAMHFLTEARRQGFTIPGDIFSRGVGFLKDLASANVKSLDQERLSAYAIYILTRNEIVTTNYLTHLQLYLDSTFKKEWHHDIINMYMAATYQLLKDYSDADKLLKLYQPTDQLIGKNDFYNQKIANAVYLYLIARHFPDVIKKDNKTIMTLVKDINQGDINTLFSSFASLSLASYTQVHQDHPATFSITEIFKDGKNKVLTEPNRYQSVSIDPGVDKMQLSNPTKQLYYYQISESGFDKFTPNKIIKNGLEVYHEYRDANQNLVTSVNLGQEIEVHIKIRALEDQYLNNIAIVDLLPGGFEVIDGSVQINTFNYVDIREDRVIFFGGVGTNVTEMVYKIKATNAGQFTVPPITANAMYNPKIFAQSESKKIMIQ